MLTQSVSAVMFHVTGAHFLTKFCVFGLEFLAVATPWSVKFNQHIFHWIIHNLLKRVCDDHLNTNKTHESARVMCIKMKTRITYNSLILH